jgi:hypothetical protein
MPYTTQQVKFFGKTAGSDLTNKLAVLNNVSIANAFRNIGLWFESIGIGARTFNGGVQANGVLATGTNTIGAVVATNTFTLNGVVFTAVASGATNNQFNVGGSSAATAANLANAINISTSAVVVNNVIATVSGAVVTITSREPGTIGNLMTMAQSANQTLSGANLSGGTDGTIIYLAKGI